MEVFGPADADDQGDARPLATTTVAATSPAAELPDAADDSGGPDDPRPAVDMAPTRFVSPREAIEKAGIETADAEEHSISQEIIANGVISYDQTRLADLGASPAPYRRIEKQLGQPFKKGDVLAIIEAMDVGKAKGELLQAVVDYQLKRGIADRLHARQSVVPERDLYEVQAEIARRSFA